MTKQEKRQRAKDGRRVKDAKVPNSQMYLAASAAGRVLGISGAAVTANARKGYLPFTSVGKLRIYKVSDIRTFYNARLEKARRAGAK